MTELLSVGAAAPEQSVFDGQGNPVSLMDFRGKKVVVYFYPKDNTPGCTTEACDFRDKAGDFEASNVVIIGISKDSVKSHSGFAAKFGLPFILLSDVEGVLCEAFGVWQMKKNYGKEYMGIVRTTFIIDEAGKIEKVFPNVKVAGHVGKVLEALS